MILRFPNLDTLQLALTSSAVPSDVTLAPAAVSFDDQFRVYVAPSVTLSKGTEKILTRLGVKGSKRHGADPVTEVGNWVQILPLVKESGAPNLASQTVVLFELTAADDLPKLVTEMLRLGNDRQSVRWINGAGEDGDERVLLRVIGPPYYTLLRALDPTASNTAGTVRAYLERTPGLWVEIGYTHPLAAQVRLADRQLALVRAPREWDFLREAAFQDVYDVLRFDLPAGAVEWSATDTPDKMTVPLRLTTGNAADVPELWVFRADATARLDTLVRDADDRLTQRLMFAVATDPGGNRTVVLRTRPSKLDPPVLALEDAVGFKPHKLPNLYLPAGKRLHPTLRRDAVRNLLAGDPDQVVWLYPDGEGGFTPESVPDAAFRPLDAWVDYVIETDEAPLAAWIGATRFDFDHFVCNDGGPKPKSGGGDDDVRAKTKDDAEKRPKSAAPPRPAANAKPPDQRPVLVSLPTHETKSAVEWKVRLRELEDRFMAADGPLDAPERQALWAELAAVHTDSGDAPGEAALCWLNALWVTDPFPAEWLAGWVRNEFPDAAGSVRAEEFDRRFKTPTPSVADQRAVVAGFLHVAARTPVPAWLTDRLPAIQQYLGKHEASLPVRAVWLAAYRMAQLAGSDVLGLARVRDRILLRLLNEGMNVERDLPHFLRYAGLRDSERLRAVREKAGDLHRAVREWVERHAKKSAGRAAQDDPILRNLPYVNLLFAFAYAKLGEATTARQLADDAGRLLDKPYPTKMEFDQFDPIVSIYVDSLLYKGFRHRIEEAILGRPHAGPLPATVFDELEGIRKKAADQKHNLSGPTQQQRVNPYWRVEVVVDWMRRESLVLEPNEAPEPLGFALRYDDPVKMELLQLEHVTDPGTLITRVRRLYKQSVAGQDIRASQCIVLHKALSLAPRAGEQFAIELLLLVPAALTPNLMKVANPPTTGEVVRTRGELVERAIFLAAHYGRVDLVQKFADQFIDLVKVEPEETKFGLVNVVARQCLRSLRKVGLRDEIDRLLTQIWSAVLQGMSLPDLRRKYQTRTTQPTWGAVLETLANLATGWMTLGLHERARPVLDEIRDDLIKGDKPKFTAQAYTELARAYVRAAGSGPADAGVRRITELLQAMPADRMTNTSTTAPHYSRQHMKLVEEVVFALVGDDFGLGPVARRWLDDDEYLVRQRVHADMRRGLDRGGLRPWS